MQRVCKGLHGVRNVGFATVLHCRFEHAWFFLACAQTTSRPASSAKWRCPQVRLQNGFSWQSHWVFSVLVKLFTSEIPENKDLNDESVCWMNSKLTKARFSFFLAATSRVHLTSSVRILCISPVSFCPANVRDT